MRNNTFKMVLVLTLTGLLTGGILAGFYTIASPRIEYNRLQELKRAIFTVLPEAKDYKETRRDGMVIYEGLDDKGELVGYAFIAEGIGFSGPIRMMVGMEKDFLKLKDMKVMEEKETPGLGTKIEDSPFKDQFKGLAIEPMVEYVKNRKPDKPNQVQAVIGATITTKAVVNGLNEGIKRAKGVLSQSPPDASGG